MNTIFALAGVVIKELYRRKDFYVLFVLTAVITLAAGMVNFFHDEKIIRYVKDLCLLLIWISALLVSVVTAARQIPAEREARTIFPLLAKPVTRGQVLLGKFLGCWLATGISLLVFYTFYAIVTGSHENHWPILSYFQAVWLQWMMLAIVIAMALLGSIHFAAPSSTATICFVVVTSILIIGSHLNTVALQQPQPLQSIFYTVYFLIPHLEWFDVRDRLVYNWALVGWLDVALATLYAAAYSGLFLLLAWLGFRRKSLNL
jgi:ABC-type transport system involved in multi-copper enzyme maturation permease subunit